jgi:thioredoxin 1
MSLSRFSLRASAAAAVLALSSFAALALEFKAYDKAAFEKSQAAGAAVLIDVYAPWCPTCKAQRSVLNGLKDNAAYKDVTVYSVDFDSQGDVRAMFGADKQSTLIGFNGKTETSRSVGETSAKGIEAIIASTMK